jgi:hypothetical protein
MNPCQGFALKTKTTKNMKKILIVDDTQANLDAAKTFFSTIPGYKFVYAISRKDAEVLLTDAYAVITDRSIPWSDLEQFNFLSEGVNKILLQEYAKVNGDYVLIMAKLMNKPAIMATDHGKFGLMVLKSVEEFKKDTKLLEILSQMSTNPTPDLYWSFQRNKTVSQGISVKWHEGMSKTYSKAWSLAWEELQKQF